MEVYLVLSGAAKLMAALILIPPDFVAD